MIIPSTAKMALASALQNATSATERAERVRTYAREWGVDESTARRHADVPLRARAQRPRGYTVPVEVLDQVVGLWLSSATEKYKTATMPLPDLINLCESAGILQVGQLSARQLRRYVAEHRITLDDQRRGRPHVHLRSEHPNHVHLADVTRCRQWYLKPTGALDVQSFKAGTAEYRNKDLRGTPVYRYVLVDHASGQLYVQYFTNETAVTLLTFLAGAWLPKRQRFGAGPTGTQRAWPAPLEPERYGEWETLPLMRDYHFRGAPQLLVLDRASANQSEFTKQLCQRLGITLVLAQEARAKGAVEAMMWKWEQRFEAALAIQPAPDLVTLNVWALDYLQRWCLRAVHSRHGMTRSQAWGLIEPGQLRELPAWPVFQELARREPEARLVKSGPAGAGVVYHEGRAWRVPDVNLIGQQVQVSYSVFHADSLEARAADGRTLVLEHLKKDRWGFFEEAPVIGQRFASHPTTITEQTRKRAEAVRAALPPLQVFGREGERGDTPTLLPPRQGVEIPVTAELGVREITERQFNLRTRAHEYFNGRAFTELEGAERDRRWAGHRTLPESSVEEFVAWCRDQAAVASPKVVNLFHR